MASERGQRKKRGFTLTRRPGAYLAGMARQCPRDRPGAAEGGLHRVAPWAPHLGVSTGERSRSSSTWACSAAQQAPAAKHRIRVLGGGRSRERRATRSPRRGSGRRFHLVELVEGVEEIISPKVAATEVTGVGWGSQAAATAIRVAGCESRGERSEAEAGLGRFDRPRSWPVGLDPAGLVGPGQRAKAHLQI
jgi:hypothetical protein